MNSSELRENVAAGTSLSKSDAASAVGAVFHTIANALASGELVTIAGFGTFTTKHRLPREGRDPRTGETIAIAASRTPAFKAGKTLRNPVNRYYRRRPRWSIRLLSECGPHASATPRDVGRRGTEDADGPKSITDRLEQPRRNRKAIHSFERVGSVILMRG